MADPFAQYAVAADDPFAAFADTTSPMQRWAESRGVPPEMAQRFAAEAAEIDAQTPLSNLTDVAGAALLGGAGKLLTKVPYGRLLTTGTAAAKAGIAKLPIVGPPLRAALKAGKEAWAGSAPKAAAAPIAETAPSPMLGPAAKPKLSASQVKQAMREHYGSEQGGRMLFGKAQGELTAAARKEAMKSGTTGGSLPKAAERAIGQRMAELTPEEALAYAAKAPNAQASSFFGSQLKEALRARMGMHSR